MAKSSGGDDDNAFSKAIYERQHEKHENTISFTETSRGVVVSVKVQNHGHGHPTSTTPIKFQVSPLRWKAACLVCRARHMISSLMSLTRSPSTGSAPSRPPPPPPPPPPPTSTNRVLAAAVLSRRTTPSLFPTPSSAAEASSFIDLATASPPPCLVAAVSRALLLLLPHHSSSSSSTSAVAAAIFPPTRIFPTLDELTTVLLLPLPLPLQQYPTGSHERSRRGSSYRSAAACFVVAAVLNHVRRTLAPTPAWWRQTGRCRYYYLSWYYGGGDGNPLEDLRLALSRPDVFVAAALTTIPAAPGLGKQQLWALCGVLATWAVEAVVGFLLRKALLSLLCNISIIPPAAAAAAAARRREKGAGSGTAREGEENGTREVALVVLKVGYVLWLLVGFECALAKAMNAAAWLVTGYKLLLLPLLGAGEEEEKGVGHVVFRRVVQGKLSQVAFVACYLVYYLTCGIGPVVWRSSVSAARGQPASLLRLMGVAWGVWMLLRYRSTFFIALEISGFFVFLGYVLFGFGLLAWEFIDDPLGLKAYATRSTLNKAMRVKPRK